MSRHAFLTSALVALTASLAGACASEEGPATWAEASPAEREAAILSAASGGSLEAYLAFVQADADNQKDVRCPKRTESDGKVKLEGGGCVAASGIKYSGRAEVTRTGSDETVVRSSEIRFDGFSLDGPGGKLVLDGTLRSNRDATGFETSATHLSIDKAGIGMRFDLQIDCDGDQHCQAALGSQGRLDGLGGFVVGYESFGDRPAQRQLVLRGTDELSLDAEPDDDGCFVYRIEHRVAGKACL